MGYREALLLVSCHSCGAEPGEPCSTFMPYSRPAGLRAVSEHASRYDLVRSIIDETGYDEDVRQAWEHRRAVENVVRDLHASLDGHNSVDAAWMRVRLSELLSVRP